MDAGPELTLVIIADVSPEAVTAFLDYEQKVLTLLPRHGGRLERRLRSRDGSAEVHVISFASRSGYQTYLADPERTLHRPLIEKFAIRQRLLEVIDV